MILKQYPYFTYLNRYIIQTLIITKQILVPFLIDSILLKHVVSWFLACWIGKSLDTHFQPLKFFYRLH